MCLWTLNKIVKKIRGYHDKSCFFIIIAFRGSIYSWATTYLILHATSFCERLLNLNAAVTAGLFNGNIFSSSSCSVMNGRTNWSGHRANRHREPIQRWPKTVWLIFRGYILAIGGCLFWAKSIFSSALDQPVGPGWSTCYAMKYTYCLTCLLEFKIMDTGMQTWDSRTRDKFHCSLCITSLRCSVEENTNQ